MTNLIPYERETVINFSEDSDICTVYTCSRPVMTKLDKLVKSQPNTYKLLKETSISKTYETNKKMISFRTPKTLSKEHKEKLKENAKKMHNK